MKAKHSAIYLNLALFLLGLILSLTTPWKPFIWEGFGDPYDYLRQAKMPFFSAEFFCPAREQLEGGGVHSPRPFTIPLFYKLMGADANAIIIMQKVMNHLAAFFMAASLLLLLKKAATRIMAVVSIHLLLNWWHVSGWALLLLSESLATSLFLCWVASWLFYLQRPSYGSAALHLIALILFSFTRDNWPYMLLPFYGLFVIFSLWRERKFLRISLAGLGLMLSIFFLQQAAADYGHRYRLPIMHNLLVRIMPNEVWWKWFADKGMPQQEELKKNFGGLESDDKKMFNLYNDKNYQPFFDWVDSKGKSAYMRFLLTHPDYTLMFHEKPKQLYKMVDYNLSYSGPSRGYTKVLHFIFPMFHWVLIFILLPFLVFAYWRSRLWIFAFALIQLLVFLLHTLVLYNADTYEVERHMFINQTIWHLLCFLAIIGAIEHRSLIFGRNKNASTEAGVV
jgi:hypothetical protein